jgi:Arc/MetJ family transcription regulator
MYLIEAFMRTNIEIDDNLMAEAMQRSGMSTKKEVVELALRALLKINTQRDIALLFGKLEWSGDLEQLRGGK